MSNETNDSNQSDAGSSAPKELPPPPGFDSDAGSSTGSSPNKKLGCAVFGCAALLFVVLAIVGSLPQIAKGIFSA